MPFAVLLFLALQKDTYLCEASYPAGSRITDPEAPGGHGTSANFPVPISRKELRGKGLTALLVTAKTGVTLHIADDQDASWLPASDGNLQGWLEAKDAAGKWRPIEYHHWSWCGNSRHRANLPKGHEFRYTVPLPPGRLRTMVRWRLAHGEGDLVSNEVPYDLASERFILSPEVARQFDLETEWRPPTLKPKGSPGGG